MGFLKRLIRDAVDEGISKGIRDAVSSAAEKIVAPKAEEYANKVADSLSEATEGLNSAAEETKSEKKTGLSSLEESLNKLSQSVEKYAETIEKQSPLKESFVKEWAEKLPEFPLWCFGGTEIWLDEMDDTTSDGNHYYYLNVENATYDALELYVTLLKKDGFISHYPKSDEVLVKELNGEYLVVVTTEAFNAAPTMSIGLYRTRDRKEFDN